jgi:RNA polymerase sigma factor (sigma-70 family)
MTAAEYNASVDQYADNLFRFVLKNIKDEEKARDIVQETFEKLWMKVNDVTFAKVKSYMFSTAYHTMIDLIRRDKKQGNFDEVEQVKMSHDSQYTDLNELLHQALDQLPEMQRSVVLLRDYEGYHYDEIGEMTGLNESQVKVYIYRARKFLKEYLGSIEAVI